MSMFKTVVIGCGKRGRDHLGVIKEHPEYKLAGIADICKETIQQLTEQYTVPGFTSTEELLQTVDSDIIVLATPPQGRNELIKTVSHKSGLKAILAEKPLETTFQNAVDMVRTCEENDILLVIGHQLRFCPELEEMRTDILAGKIGNIQFIRGVCCGTLFDQGSHLLDAMYWVLGNKKLKWVQSSTVNDQSLLSKLGRVEMIYKQDELHPGPMWMTHYLSYDGDVRGVLENGLLYQRGGIFHGDWGQQRITVIGTHGSAEFQVGSHYRLITDNTSENKQKESSKFSYARGTNGMYNDLLVSLSNNNSETPRNTGADSLQSFEALIACGESAQDGRLVEILPEQNRSYSIELGTGIFQNDSQSDISVLIPLYDHRGHAKECILSWSKEQTYPTHRIELMVIANENQPEINDLVKSLLSKYDQFIINNSTNAFALYDLAALKAKGRILLITEAHCVADPHCIEELLKRFATHDEECVLLRPDDRSSSYLGPPARRFFTQMFSEWIKERDFTNVNMEGYALYKDTYFNAGGFESKYDYFSIKLLSLKLLYSGVRAGYAPGASFKHYDEYSFRIFFEDTPRYAEGEIKFFLEDKATAEQLSLDAPAELSEQSGIPSDNLNEFIRLLIKGSLVSAKSFGIKNVFIFSGGLFLHLLKQSLKNTSLPIFFNRLKLYWYCAQCSLLRFSPELLFKASCNLRDQLLYCGRITAIRKQLSQIPNNPPCKINKRHGINEIPEEHLIGFYDKEKLNGENFRWGRPVSGLVFDIDENSSQITIDTEGIRGILSINDVTFIINGFVIREISSDDRGNLTFQLSEKMINRGQVQTLLIIATPLQPWKVGSADHRNLGLPIFSIEAS